MIEFNINSPQHISLILFSGYINEDVIEPVLLNGIPVVIKTGKNQGQLKTHKVKKQKFIKGIGIKPNSDWKIKKEGFYSTNETVLNFIANSKEFKHINGKNVCQILLKIRELQKQISTYYAGFEELIYKEDNCVHQSFSHVATPTGRLGCSKPNTMNVPTEYSNIKKHYISRFKNGYIVVADYSSIEPRIEAQLSGDKNKIDDILNGVDDHTKNLAFKKHVSYEEAEKLVKSGEWINERSKIKPVTFGFQYGAIDSTISKNSGIPEEEVAIIRAERIKVYKKLYEFHEGLKQQVYYKGFYKDPFNRIYKFNKYVYIVGKRQVFDSLKHQNIEWKAKYNDNEIMNYISQGFATGVIVLIMLGKFWREKALFDRHKYLLINTVHDNVMIDCKKEYLEDGKQDLLLLEQVHQISKNHFDYSMTVPITVDIKYGHSWFDCK